MNEHMTNHKILDVGVDSVSKHFAQLENRQVEVKDYRPISYDEVKTYMSKKIYVPVDHHH